MTYSWVVSTKLTEEEHSRLLDVCNVIGCTSSTLIRDAILKMINVDQQRGEQEFNPIRKFAKELNTKSRQEKTELPIELAKLFGIKEIR